MSTLNLIPTCATKIATAIFTVCLCFTKADIRIETKYPIAQAQILRYNNKEREETVCMRRKLMSVVITIGSIYSKYTTTYRNYYLYSFIEIIFALYCDITL